VISFILTGKDEFASDFHSKSTSVTESLDEAYNHLAGSPDLQMLVKSCSDSLSKWIGDFAEPAIAAHKSGRADPETTISRLQTLDDTNFKNFRQSLAEFRSKQTALLSAKAQAVSKSNDETKLLVYIGVPFVTVLTFVLFYLLSGTVVRPFYQAEALVEAVTSGDLHARFDAESRNEVGRLGKALNTMVDTLRDQIRNMVEGVSVLTSAASEIATTGAQLAENTNRTSMSVTETSTTVEQVKQAAALVRQTAQTVADSARQAVTVSGSGTQATEDTINAMGLIQQQMQSIRDTVLKLSDQSRHIEAIIEAVQDLAEQSNLLAVNASIEAARAGEQGRGFTVVAQEIKMLADESRNATAQVRNILDETRKWVAAVVMATEQGGKAVEGGLEQSKEAGSAIHALSESVGESAQAAQVIDSSSQQQIAGYQQVSMAMINIEEATRQNLDGASQLKSAAERLQELGGALQQSVEGYRL
jgi:methyl-accepting chemotaxis protein